MTALLRLPWRLALLDLLLAVLTVYAVAVLHFEHWWPPDYRGGLALALLLYPPILLLALRRYGAYRRVWPYAGLRELRLLVRATVAAVLVATLLQAALARLQPTLILPPTLSLLLLPFALAAAAAPRLALRLAAAGPAGTSQRGEPLLIVGAGAAGSQIVRELQANPQLGLRAVALIDDDPAKRGLLLHGVPVLGGRDQLAAAVHSYGVSRAVIAVPSADGTQMRALHDACRAVGLQVQSVPGLRDLLSGRAELSRLRPVEISDLLRRAPICTDTAAVAALIAGRSVLISGGGGSIGSELCRQLLQFRPARLLLLGHGENSLFEAEAELQRLAAGLAHPPQIIALVADVRDAARLRTLLRQHRPQVVFHAAAHKHVPLMEQHPAEAVLTNIGGTANLLAAAEAAAVERFVLISTDKAVNPASVMGVTKRIAELLVRAAARRSGRPYVAVRFGNVLGSRGSVVQTFRRQLAQGGPLTITDPAMTRYFMTIPEAVQLVLQALQLGRPGDLFMLDMGRPVRILDLAHDMIRLSGLQEGRDVQITISGRRPGEKLHEELQRSDEQFVATSHPAIAVAAGRPTTVLPDARQVSELRRLALIGDERRLRAALQRIVPEYCPQEDDHADPQLGRSSSAGARRTDDPPAAQPPDGTDADLCAVDTVSAAGR
jgi:FlaA1/EpsC-like NDP-sugar epimerase